MRPDVGIPFYNKESQPTRRRSAGRRALLARNYADAERLRRPGSMAAATIRSFSARDQLRRRCTDVITSTCVLVIGVVLGLPLGLAAMTQLRKAVLTECLPWMRRCCVGLLTGTILP